jgi:hypothetical protein
MNRDAHPLGEAEGSEGTFLVRRACARSTRSRRRASQGHRSPPRKTLGRDKEMSRGRSEMSLLIVLMLLIVLDVAAWFGGQDSRDGRDWNFRDWNR